MLIEVAQLLVNFAVFSRPQINGIRDDGELHDASRQTSSDYDTDGKNDNGISSTECAELGESQAHGMFPNGPEALRIRRTPFTAGDEIIRAGVAITYKRYENHWLKINKNSRPRQITYLDGKNIAST